MATEFAEVKPDVLRWARESAGATIEEAAKWAGVDPERYSVWESSGEEHPTLSKLNRLANGFKRPLALFFLAVPPEESRPPKDFRKVAEAGTPLSRSFTIQFRQALERRDLALGLFEDLGEEPLGFDFKATLEDSAADVADRMRKFLGVSISDQIAWRYGNKGDIAFNAWRSAIEAAGVLVFQFEKVPRSEMRGVSVAEFPLPLIIVNRDEYQNARVFSLFHEMTHLALREGGLCDMTEDRGFIEVFCNRVAGEFLVPSEALLATDIVRGHGDSISWSDDELRVLGRTFKVSEEVILRRLLTLKMTTNGFYAQKRKEFDFRVPKKKSGGPPPAIDALSKHGYSYAGTVLRGHHEGHVTFTDAASFLGVSGKHIPEIEARLSKAGA